MGTIYFDKFRIFVMGGNKSAANDVAIPQLLNAHHVSRIITPSTPATFDLFPDLRHLRQVLPTPDDR